jgi:hypothetical protein
MCELVWGLFVLEETPIDVVFDCTDETSFYSMAILLKAILFLKTFPRWLLKMRCQRVMQQKSLPVAGTH